MTPSTPLPTFGSLKDLLPRQNARASIRAFSFYTAIALPLLYLPVLMTGVASGELPLLAALLFANALALVLGHRYERD